MKVISKVIYQGGLRTHCTHLSSDNQIITDAPKDNHGNGAAFSPTDLLATSLASCIFTIMGIYARKHDINMDGVDIEVSKVMYSNPRRIGEIHLNINMKKHAFSPQDKLILERAAQNCPVENSLHPDIIIHKNWTWKY